MRKICGKPKFWQEKSEKILHKANSQYKEKINVLLCLLKSPRKIIKIKKTSEIILNNFFKFALGNESGNASDTNDELNNIPQDEILNKYGIRIKCPKKYI